MDFAICLGVAAVAAFTDWKIRKVRNSLVLPILALGLVRPIFGNGLPVFQEALMGSALPLVLFPFFAMRMLGAGDIKLLMALGTWLGFKGCASLMIFSILTGGAMALVILLIQQNGRQRLIKLWIYLKACGLSGKLLPYQDFSRLEEGSALPFAVAVFGGLICLWGQQSGLIPPVI